MNKAGLRSRSAFNKRMLDKAKAIVTYDNMTTISELDIIKMIMRSTKQSFEAAAELMLLAKEAKFITTKGVQDGN